jgi:hypothetical protein
MTCGRPGREAGHPILTKFVVLSFLYLVLHIQLSEDLATKPPKMNERQLL